MCTVADLAVQSPSMQFSMFCPLRLMETGGGDILGMDGCILGMPRARDRGILGGHLKGVSLRPAHPPGTGTWA